MTEYSKLTYFWELLEDEGIVIPIIQRDYAQGRIGKEYLRENFLNQLFTALKKDEKDAPLTLDFVYGSYENNNLYPLDGQQRLTTLWLLHWYLALCAGTLDSDGNTLAKFTYATRVSSRTFCEKLCSIRSAYMPEHRGENQEASIITFIKDQHWFHSVYEQDPTIQSMLRMLGGTDKTNKEGLDIVDGIEEHCLKLTKEEMAKYLDNLKSENSPIKFYLLNMQDKNLPLSDDLYIKMNARGKVLTDFENFKADLLNYKTEDNNGLIESIDKQVELVESFGHLLDTKWTDIFWYHRSKEYKIDEIYFEFLNRFFLTWFMANIDKGSKPETITSHDFYKNITSKDELRYKNITIYEPVLTTECLSALYTILNNLYRLSEHVKTLVTPEHVGESVNKLFMSPWADKKGSNSFFFIPKYLEDGTISPISNPQRVATHAIFIYLEKCSKVNEASLSSWMYFVWKMLENSYIDKEQAVSAIRFFDSTLPELQSEDKGINMVDDITKYLASLDENNLPAELFGRKQLKEEIIKAKKCIDDTNWAKKIKDAENTYFFKGAISFLFNDKNGKPEAWNLFDKKFDRAKDIFDENGVKEDFQVKTLQCLYSYCTDWGTQFWWYYKIFNCTASTWKDNILTYVNKEYKYVYASSVHHILMGDKPNSEIADERIRALANPSMIVYILDKTQEKRDMYIRLPYDALHYCGERQGILLSKEYRDQAITQMLADGRFTLRDKDVQIHGTTKFWGFDIDLTFQEDSSKPIHFRWYRDNTGNGYDIYLLNENWEYKIRSQEKPEEERDRKRYYCFNVEEEEPTNVVEHIVSKLKKEFEEMENK